MPDYTLRRRDRGTVETLERFNAPNDYEALIRARRLSWVGTGELWDGSRMVAVVKPWRPHRG